MAFQYDVVIGLEIHAQLITQTKCFSPASVAFGIEPNKNVDWICAGYPGMLPVLNEEVVHKSVCATLAFHGELQKTSRFARKQYFYPDMPKGYQISQYDQPICVGGHVEFLMDGQKCRVNLERAHIEEDAGKSTHFGQYSLIDLNRAGTPLLEIVSRPEMTSPAEAASYAKAVRQLLRYYNICDGNLEEGSLRCDCNISLKPKGRVELGTKVEIKNLNSFRFIEKALEYEIQRQAHQLDMGEEIIQETRLYDSAKNKTFSMRKKEDATDYRYFPDPDLPVLAVGETLLRAIQNDFVEGPMARFDRFVQDYGLLTSEAELLTSERELADFYEVLVKKTGEAKVTCNWVVGEFLRLLNENKIELSQRPPIDEEFAVLIQKIVSKDVTGPMGKEILVELWNTHDTVEVIMDRRGFRQVSDESELLVWVNQVIEQNPKVVQDYLAGKEKLFGFFVGQVMKLSRGQASPEVVNRLIKERLK